MANARRSYTREFKLAAVKLITEQDYSVAEAARRLGLRALLPSVEEDASRPPATKRSRGKAFFRLSKKKSGTSGGRRINACRWNAHILKKATAFFAAEAR